MRHFFLALLLCAVSFAEAVREPCDFETTVEVSSGDQQLAKKVENVFSVSCKTCHGRGATGGANVMTDILDRDLLVKEGMVTLTEPASSKIVRALNRPVNWMPLGGSQLPDSDKQAILSWVEAGAPDWKDTVPVTDPILTHLQEVECIAHDQATYTEKDAYYIRYFTLGHLKGKDFSLAKAGLSKLVNSLTFYPVPRATVAVDRLGKIQKIDLRHYEPNLDFNAWERIVIQAYPYAYLSFDDKFFNFYVEKINKYGYSERAFVRGDWFVEETSQSPKYERILRLPATLQELEHGLQIDVEKDLISAYAKRGSVSKSGVTNYPRLVDRFDFEYFTAGHYIPAQHWITRDFSSDKGTSNIYAFPFGPRILSKYSGWTEAQFFAAKVFSNQAGESIDSLPNGLNYYGIWDGQGKRLEKADPHIAVDKSHLFDDLTVRNGISCMYCHASGPNVFDDDSVIRHIRQSPSFTVDETKFAEELFFTPDQRHEAFASHQKAFKEAMTAIGLTEASYFTPNGEPVSQVFRKFDSYMTCVDLAWELGIKVDELVKFLHHSPDLARELGLADCTTGRLSRENYEHLFGKIVKQFDIGLQLKVGGGHVVDKCHYILSNDSKRTVKFDVSFADTLNSLRFDQGQSKAFEFNSAINGVVKNLVYWDGYKWVRVSGAWTVQGCVNYAFLWNNNKVQLFSK